jgi:hypothetical protein
MSDLLTAIRAEGEAADSLTRACARQGALADAVTANDNPYIGTLRRHYREAGITPTDMLVTLGKMKRP